MPLRLDSSPAGAASGGNLDKILRMLGDGLAKIMSFLNGSDSSPGPDFNAVTINNQYGTSGPVNPQPGTIVRTDCRNWLPRNSSGTQQSNPGLYWFDGTGWRQMFTLAESVALDDLTLDYVPVDTTLRIGYMENDEAFGAKNSSGTVQPGYYPRTAGDDSVFRVGSGGSYIFRDQYNTTRATMDLSGSGSILSLSGPTATASTSSTGFRVLMNGFDKRWGLGLSKASEGTLYTTGIVPMIADEDRGCFYQFTGDNLTGTIIRRITLDGEIKIVAGSFTAFGTTDGQGTTARFRQFFYCSPFVVKPGSRLAYIVEYDTEPYSAGYGVASRIREIDLDTITVTTKTTSASYSGKAPRSACWDSSGYLWTFHVSVSTGDGVMIARKWDPNSWTATDYVTSQTVNYNPDIMRQAVAWDEDNNCFYLSHYYGIMKYVRESTTCSVFCGAYGTSGTTDASGSSARFPYLIYHLVARDGYLYVGASNFLPYPYTPVPYNIYSLSKVLISTATKTTIEQGTTANAYNNFLDAMVFMGDRWYFALYRSGYASPTVRAVFMDGGLIGTAPGDFISTTAIAPQSGYKIIAWGSANDGGGPDKMWSISAGGFDFYDDAGIDRFSINSSGGAAFYNSSGTAKFTVDPSLTINDPADGKVYLAALKSIIAYDAQTPSAGAYTINLSAVALYPVVTLKITPPSASNVNLITNGTNGQLLVIVAGNNNLTMTHVGGSIILPYATDYPMASGEAVTLVNVGGVWHEFSRSGVENSYGTAAPGAGAYTFNVTPYGSRAMPVTVITPSAAANINAITGGTDGQTQRIVAGNGNLTITHVGGSIVLRGGVDYVMAAGEVCTLVKANGVWYEQSRTAA